MQEIGPRFTLRLTKLYQPGEDNAVGDLEFQTRDDMYVERTKILLWSILRIKGLLAIIELLIWIVMQSARMEGSSAFRSPITQDKPLSPAEERHNTCLLVRILIRPLLNKRESLLSSKSRSSCKTRWISSSKVQRSLRMQSKSTSLTSGDIWSDSNRRGHQSPTIFSYSLTSLFTCVVFCSIGSFRSTWNTNYFPKHCSLPSE